MREDVVTDGTPVGLVTDRDVAAGRLDAGQMTAGAVMSESPVTIDASAGVLELSETMHEERVRRMPVVDDDELVGIVTTGDLTVVSTVELTTPADVVAAESPPY